MYDSVRHKTRHIFFLEEDEADFSRELRREIGDVLFVPNDNIERLPLESEGSLDRCGGLLVKIWSPPPGWVWEMHKPMEKWVVRHPPLWVTYLRGGWLRRHLLPEEICELPTPDYGRFTASFHPDNKEHQRFLRRVWKVIERVSSNRLESLDYRSLEPRGMDIRNFWAGFHAIRWCLESDRRALWRLMRPTAPAIAAAKAALEAGVPGGGDAMAKRKAGRP